MNIEKSRLISEAAPHLNASLGTINGNEFAAIVPVIPGHIGGRETNIVSAKALHKALGVGKDFSTWITDRISEYDFTIGHDYSVHKTISPNLGKSPNGAAYSKIKQSGRPGKDYLLSVGMAKELAMIERNDQGRAIRRYFIQCEEELQRSVPEIAARYRRQLKARISAANNFKPMCDALNMARAEMGKTTQQHHYTNESNMISRIVLGGLTAKQWARINGYSGEPRDHMNAEQLEHLSYLESTNITLIDMGMEVVDHLFCSCSDSTKTFVHARDVNEMSAMYCASGSSNSEFSESIKKSLPLCGNTVYGYKAPHKTGAGIGVLKILKATYDAPSVFFYVVGLTHPFFGRWCIIQRLCQSMVAQAGASSEAPVSFRAGYANPVWATTSEIGVSGGSVTCYLKEAATCWLLPLPKNRNLSGLSPQFAAIARQLPPKFIILLPSLNAMLAVLWCAITSAFLLVVSAWRWHMIKTYDVHMDPLERTSQIITLTEVINDILVSSSPSRDEKLKALLAILDLAVRDVHFLLEGGEMPGKTGATNE